MHSSVLTAYRNQMHRHRGANSSSGYVRRDPVGQLWTNAVTIVIHRSPPGMWTMCLAVRFATLSRRSATCYCEDMDPAVDVTSESIEAIARLLVEQAEQQLTEQQ